MQNPLRWIVRRRRLVIGTSVCLFLLLNLFAYMHARAFTHYTRAGAKTETPEALGLWHKAKVLFAGVNIPRPENSFTPAEFELPFATHFISATGATLEAWHIPAEPSRGLVVMFHGHAGCKCSLLREAIAFREMGYSIMLVDFRGSGGSSESITTIGVLEADDVAAAVAFCRSQWPGQKLVLYGQSMGAAAILRAIAVNSVAPDAIMLECPFDSFLTTVGNRFNLMGLPAFPMARLLIFWGGVQNGFDAFRHNPVEYAQAVHCPALVMHGKLDRHVHVSEAESVYNALAGPNQWTLFDDAGHEAYCARFRDRWCETVNDFLATRLK